MTFKFILAISVLICGLIANRLFTLPPLAREKVFREFHGKQRYTWISDAREPVAPHEISKTKVFKSFFSLDQSLDRQETQTLLRILSDPDYYSDRAAESGLVEGDVIFIYYNQAGLQIGESHLNLYGEVQTIGVKIEVPGYLTSQGLEQLKNTVFQ